jgi:ankyrin repeat protein
MDPLSATERMSLLLTLPNELIFEVGSHLKSFKDLNGLACTSRFFHTMFNSILYRRAVGADPNVLDDIVGEVLFYYELDSLVLLLDNGLSVHYKLHLNSEDMLQGLCGYNASQEERAVEMARLLIERGADIRATAEDGHTVLHSAARGYYLISKLLLKHGAEVDATDMDGSTPLHYASYRALEGSRRNLLLEHGAVVKLLLEHGADVNATDKDGSTPLHFASYRDLEGSTRNLLLEHGAVVNARDKKGRTPLYLASHRGNLVAIESLLAHGADIDVLNNQGSTALHGLCKRAKPDARKAAKMLLDHGADINATNKYGETPLYLACRRFAANELVSKEEEFAVKFLLDSGADVNATDMDGLTPLHQAFEFEDNQPENVFSLAKLLLENGADVNKSSEKPESPLEMALHVEMEEVVALLIKHGADVSVLNNKDRKKVARMCSGGRILARS